MRRHALVLLPLACALAAGCAAEPGESLDPPCGPYETLHYEQAPDRQALKEAFEEAMYTWEDRNDRIADVTAPGGGELVVSHEPGPSGDALVVSAQGADAHALALGASAIVNFTSEDARLDRWIEGNSCLGPPREGREV